MKAPKQVIMKLADSDTFTSVVFLSLVQTFELVNVFFVFAEDKDKTMNS